MQATTGQPDNAATPRQRILTAATTVFTADGFNAGSLNVIAERADMSRQRLLHYYPSKRTLLLAVLEDRDERLTFHPVDADSITLAAFFTRLDNLNPAIYAQRELMQLSHQLTAEATDPDHPAHEWVRHRQQHIRAEIAADIRNLIARNELPAWLDADGFAAVLLGAIEGIEIQSLVETTWDHRPALDALRSLVLATAGASGDSGAPATP